MQSHKCEIARGHDLQQFTQITTEDDPLYSSNGENINILVCDVKFELKK